MKHYLSLSTLFACLALTVGAAAKPTTCFDGRISLEHLDGVEKHQSKTTCKFAKYYDNPHAIARFDVHRVAETRELKVLADARVQEILSRNGVRDARIISRKYRDFNGLKGYKVFFRYRQFVQHNDDGHDYYHYRVIYAFGTTTKTRYFIDFDVQTELKQALQNRYHEARIEVMNRMLNSVKMRRAHHEAVKKRKIRPRRDGKKRRGG